MGTEPIAAFPLGGSHAITASSLTRIDAAGLVFEREFFFAMTTATVDVDRKLLRTRPRALAQLAAWLFVPAGETIEACLAREYSDRRLETVPGSTISLASGTDTWTRMVGAPVDITALLDQTLEPLSLRVCARITGGTGTIEAPTLMLLRAGS